MSSEEKKIGSESQIIRNHHPEFKKPIIPRPIGFVSTVSKEGKHNLAPFSYFTVVNSDPPIFTLGFSRGENDRKDTFRNILGTGELTINIIKSTKVKPPHVAESAFSIEAKLLYSHDWTYKKHPNPTTGTLCIVEGVNFHAREDVINEGLNTLDIDQLKPLSRLGEISYGRTINGYERFRPNFNKEILGDEEAKQLIR